MTTESFDDRFAYAVALAQLRDGVSANVQHLRKTNSVNELEDLLDEEGRLRLRQLLEPYGWRVSIDEYNDAWAEAYIAMVERCGSGANDNPFDRIIARVFADKYKKVRP